MYENRREGVTVIIPVRNAVATVGAQLDALALQDHGVDFEVIVSCPNRLAGVLRRR